VPLLGPESRGDAAVSGMSAPAVRAASLGASSAGRHHLLLERQSRPVDSDGGIVRRDPLLRCERGNRHPLDLDALQGRRVLRLERRCEPSNARTHSAVELGTFVDVIELPGQGFEGTAGRVLATVMVGHRVAKNPVEPRSGRLIVAQVGKVIHGSTEGVLEDVFRRRPISDATLEETKEGVPVLDQDLQRPVI
jgi:hypothetical protein